MRNYFIPEGWKFLNYLFLPPLSFNQKFGEIGLSGLQKEPFAMAVCNEQVKFCDFISIRQAGKELTFLHQMREVHLISNLKIQL